MPKVSGAVRERAVIRCLAGQSSPTEEGRRLGVRRQTVHEWIKEFKEARPEEASKIMADAGAPAPVSPRPGPETSPSAPGAPSPAVAPDDVVPGGADPGKARLEAARSAAGVSASELVADAAASAKVDDASFCCETLAGFKTAGVYLGATVQGIPSDEPALPKIAKLSDMARGVIAQNAGWLAPMLRKQSGPEMLYGILALEAVLAFMGLRRLAARYRPTPAPAPEAADEGTGQ
jgi:hypothetical protein